MAKKMTGLGAGLDVLFGGLPEEDDRLLTLPIEKVEPRENQPREVFRRGDRTSLQACEGLEGYM